MRCPSPTNPRRGLSWRARCKRLRGPNRLTLAFDPAGCCRSQSARRGCSHFNVATAASADSTNASESDPFPSRRLRSTRWWFARARGVAHRFPGSSSSASRLHGCGARESGAIQVVCDRCAVQGTSAFFEALWSLAAAWAGAHRFPRGHRRTNGDAWIARRRFAWRAICCERRGGSSSGGAMADLSAAKAST